MARFKNNFYFLSLVIAPLFLIAFFLFSKSALAATGDLLSACDFESTGSVTQTLSGCGFGYIDQTTGAIATEGWNGGKCYKGYYPANSNDLHEGKFWSSVGNKNEITVVYYERYSIPNQSGYCWNFKGIRPKNGDSDYMGGTVSQWSRDCSDSWYLQGHLGSATLNVTSAVSRVNTNDGYCTSVGGSTYRCANYLAVEFSPAYAWGTAWRKVRMYFKAPSSPSAKDGVTKLWIDETLMYTATEIAGNSSMLPYFTYVDFRPSDDFFSGTPKPALYHYYDDIKIYEGQVGPGNFTPPACAPAWTCSGFSVCQNSTQSRTCTDQNNCNTTTGRPALTQSCTVTDHNATTITVDSTYPGYDQARIDDGVMNASGMEQGTWASEESSTNPHWIEFSFPQAKTINYADIYWAYNPTRSAYMSSQTVRVEYWNGGQYVTAGTIVNSGSVAKSSLNFNQISTTKLRFYQPANQGFAAYPAVLWLTEVDYGMRAQTGNNGDLNNDGQVDITDLGIFLAAWGFTNRPIADLDQNGEVDITDLGIILGNWGSVITEPYCGDGSCNGSEECSACSDDCGVCVGDTIDPVVSVFTVSPTALTVGQSVTAEYAVSDNVGLARAELWRARKQTGNCESGLETGCAWSSVSAQSISGTSRSDAMSDTPLQGTWLYGLHAVDQSGNWGRESARVTVTVNAAPTTPVCGQNGCESGESCYNCVADCGQCQTNGGWTRSLTFESGAVGSQAQGTPDSFTYAGTNVTIDNTRFHSGNKAAKVHWVANGTDNWPIAVGLFEFPDAGVPNVSEGGEIWYRAYWYNPPGFDYCGTVTVKQMRISPMEGGSNGQQSILSQGNEFSYSCESPDYTCISWNGDCDGSGPWISGSSRSIPIGRWYAFEYYLKFLPGDGGILRVWADGELIIERHGNLYNSGDVFWRTQIGGVWNGGPCKSQDQWVDDIVITTATPSGRDANGNPMIGL